MTKDSELGMDTTQRRFVLLAIAEARKSQAEDERPHPKVGVVVVRDNRVLATAYRGECDPGDHAEFTALEKKLENETLAGATIYTTLEPCTTRKHPKVPCAQRIVERKVAKVVIGMLDPNPDISGKGQMRLRDANIATELFPSDLMAQVEELNREFIRHHRPGTPATPATPDKGRSITLQIPLPPSGTGRVEVGLTIDYVDGLPQAPPKIRDPFLEAQRLEKANKYREAIKQYEACFQPETTPSQRAALHILIGNCFLSLRELEEAEGHYREAETVAKEINDQEGLAAALGNMGLVHRIKGKLNKALQHHRQALKIDRDIGNREGEASDLGNMGLVYQTKGELDKALQHYQQALKIHRDIGNREGEANQLGNMGSVYGIKGEVDKALDCFQEALHIFEEIGAKLEVEKTKRNIQKLSEAKTKA